MPNGSSIGLLLEHRGASVVLAGDGFGGVLADGPAEPWPARAGSTASTVDAFKLPHHGSRGNVLRGLLSGRTRRRHYVFSSNGDTFHHPDDAAVARTVLTAPRGATLWFNYRNAGPSAGPTPRCARSTATGVRFPEGPTSGAVLRSLRPRGASR